MFSQTPSSEPKVTVSITTFNALKTLPKCLESVFDQTYPNLSVLVVDNASTDGTPDWVAEHYPQVKLIRHQDNRGPNPARNTGILNAESNLVLLLDDDAFMEAGCIAQLVRAAQRLCDATVLAPRLVYSDRPRVIQHEGANIHYVAEAVLVNCDHPVEHGSKEPHMVSCVSGTCLLLKRDAALSIGLFDEDYFFGRTDGEFTFRLRLAGHFLFVVPQAVVHHRVKKRGISKVYYQVRNRWYFALTTFSWRTLILALPAFVVYEVALATFLLAKGAIKDYISGSYAAFKDLPKILEKRRKFQASKVIRDRDILECSQFNMRSDLLNNWIFASLKALLDAFFSAYWRVIYPLI